MSSMKRMLAGNGALLLVIGAFASCSSSSTSQTGGDGGTADAASSIDSGVSPDAATLDAALADGSSVDASITNDVNAADAPSADVSIDTAPVDASSGDGASAAEASAPEGGGSSCTDGVKDGNETGVDCGGSCPACVSYITGQPETSNTDVGNACAPQGATTTSFICPRFMLFSGEMKQAASDDAAANGWPAGSFNYGVATLNGANCCACYQIVYDTPPNGLTYAPPKPLIIQNFNEGGANNAFDVFMGKGGEGAQTTGCPQLYTTYPSTGEPNGGGITASAIMACTTSETALASSACVSDVAGECDQIVGNNTYITTTTQTSCVEANSAASPYHENWNVKAQQVECPTALTEVTGCKPTAGSNPKPDPTVQTASEASSWSSFTTTTMEDCCKPSCAWPGNVKISTQAGWASMYQCDSQGNPMTN
jgi:hypothetical protein